MKLYLENYVFNFSPYNCSCPRSGTACEPRAPLPDCCKTSPRAKRLSWQCADSKEILDTLAVTRVPEDMGKDRV